VAVDFSGYSKYTDVAAVTGMYYDATNGERSYTTADTLPTGAFVIKPATAAVKAVDNRTRFSANYNLGVATVGLGYQVKSYVTAGNADNKQMTYGVSAPLGAFTVGAVYASSKDEGAATKTTGNEVGVNYAFSKRTSLQVARASWKKTGAAADTLLRARLMHSF
jgi:predicted porin